MFMFKILRNILLSTQINVDLAKVEISIVLMSNRNRWSGRGGLPRTEDLEKRLKVYFLL